MNFAPGNQSRTRCFSNRGVRAPESGPEARKPDPWILKPNPNIATASRADDQVRRSEPTSSRTFTDLWAALTRERELTRSRDRLRELAVVLARRETAGESAGFDRLRAEREIIDVEADRAAGRRQARGRVPRACW